LKNCRTTHPTTVRNVKGIFTIDRYVTFNPFGESKKSKDLTFFIFDFHDFFDGLIGYESLQDLKANILTEPNLLELPDVKIQMYKKFLNEKTQMKLLPNQTKLVKIPTIQENGETWIDQDFNLNETICIHSGIYNVNDFLIHVLATNIGTEPVEIPTLPISLELNNFDTETFPKDFPKQNPELLSQIRTQHLNVEEDKLILEFQHCFYMDKNDLTFTNAVRHKIETKDEIPIHTKSYRYPYCHKEEVQRQISKMLEQGIIQHSHSPWSSPIWIVPKKLDASGKRKWRLVVDYRKLNEKTIDDRYPLPLITDLLDKLGKCNYFTTLDLASGFHQIEIDPTDIPKTAFTVENGHYEFIRMPFGLKNAPATFQRVMDNVLRDLMGKICLVYMDDIIVFSTSLQEHVENLKRVFEALDRYNLKIQLDKSEFLCKEVAFLGHIVTPNGVKPNPNKVEAIKNWPLPNTEKELRGFLGTMGYYRRFVKDMAKIIRPMTVQLKKGQSIEHTPDFVEAFEKSKTLLTSSHILQYPDFSQPFVLTTDASDFALGAVLSQGPVGKDRPVAYASRTLTKSEINYSTIEKELLAIIWACKHFRPYLFGKKFTLFTDHKPLTYIFSLKTPNSKLVRWRLALEEYQYEIRYRPGKQNVVADGLSRIKLELNVTENDMADDLSHVSMMEEEPNASNVSMEENQQHASDVSMIVSTAHSADTDDTHFIQMTEKALNMFSDQIVLKIDTNESFQFEEIFPRVYRRTISKMSYTEPVVLNIFREYIDPKRTNCIMCPESLIPLLQTVYRNYFARNRTFKIFISQKLLHDLRTLEEQNEKIEEIHDRA